MEYRYGRRKELQVGEFLERRGWAWAVSRGSRGPVDLLAERGRTRIAIQVKATSSDAISYNRLSLEPERKLQCLASRAGFEPVGVLQVRGIMRVA